MPWFQYINDDIELGLLNITLGLVLEGMSGSASGLTGKTITLFLGLIKECSASMEVYIPTSEDPREEDDVLLLPKETSSVTFLFYSTMDSERQDFVKI